MKCSVIPHIELSSKTYVHLPNSSIKEYNIWRISFSKFLDAISAFTCAREICNLWCIYLGVDSFNLFSWLVSYLYSDTMKG